MKPFAQDPVIAAAADLLAERPEVTNLELLQRLALSLGGSVTRRIPVNRVQRHVREPALALLRRRGQAGHAPAARVDGAGENVAKRRRPPSTPPPKDRPRVGRKGGPERVDAESVDCALLEAFELGVVSSSPGEVVEAFRRLDQVRSRVSRILQNAGG